MHSVIRHPGKPLPSWETCLSRATDLGRHCFLVYHGMHELFVARPQWPSSPFSSLPSLQGILQDHCPKNIFGEPPQRTVKYKKASLPWKKGKSHPSFSYPALLRFWMSLSSDSEGLDVEQEGAKGDAPAVSSRQSPMSLQEPVLAPSAEHGAAQEARVPPRGQQRPQPHPPA